MHFYGQKRIKKVCFSIFDGPLAQNPTSGSEATCALAIHEFCVIDENRLRNKKSVCKIMEGRGHSAQ